MPYKTLKPIYLLHFLFYLFQKFQQNNINCPLLKLTERLGLSTQNDPRKQRFNSDVKQKN